MKKRDTWIGLASTLGFARTSFNEWRTLKGAPKTPAVKPWKNFIAKHNLGVVGNRVSPERERTLHALNERKLRLADLEIARREGKTVLRADMDSLHHAIFSRQKAVLRAALASEYPGKVVGRSAAEIRVYGEQLCDRICGIFTQDLERWTWPDGDAGGA